MNADQILRAIRYKHHSCAVVQEMVLDDTWAGMPWSGPHPDPDHAGDRPVRRRRIDALMFDGGQLTAFEIKVSKADYKRETVAKRLPWQRLVHRFIYVAPVGVILPRDIPRGCGLWEVSDSMRLSTVKKCIVNKYPEPLPYQITQALAYRAQNA